jgi:hypothetical protein
MQPASPTPAQALAIATTPSPLVSYLMRHYECNRKLAMSKPSGWRSSDDTSTKAADDADDSDHDHVHDNNRLAPV